MKYDIEVEYTTGDSFGSSEEVDKLGFEFVDIKTAEENALRIAEHYKMYERVNTGYERVKPDEFDGEGEWEEEVDNENYGCFINDLDGYDSKYYMIYEEWMDILELHFKAEFLPLKF